MRSKRHVMLKIDCRIVGHNRNKNKGVKEYAY